MMIEYVKVWDSVRVDREGSGLGKSFTLGKSLTDLKETVNFLTFWFLESFYRIPDSQIVWSCYTQKKAQQTFQIW